MKTTNLHVAPVVVGLAGVPQSVRLGNRRTRPRLLA